MEKDREVEGKPIGASAGDGSRPLSWGEREQQRRRRKRTLQTSALERTLERIMRRMTRLARSLGLTRRKIDAQGVVYRERSGLPLRRALSPTGPGVKEYDVRFAPGSAVRGAQHPSRESMRIRYTHRRIYADLGHDPRVRLVQILRQRVRPGQRVLELGCGTGASSAMLAVLVGPSGGVVAINRDGESIRFARQRYRWDHLGFELGWLETLGGELDGAFDAAVAIDLFRDAPDEPSKSRAISSLWRVVREGGTLLVACSDRNRLDDVTDRFSALGAVEMQVLDPDPVLLWTGVIAVKPTPRTDSHTA